MENKVGQKIPSEKDVQKWVGEEEKLASETGPFTASLTTDERKGTLKFRPGGEPMVMLLANLARKFGVELANAPLDGMLADLTLAQRLAPLAQAQERNTQRTQDTILEAQSECWWAATAYYTALDGLSRTNPDIKTALQPVYDFFALGRRKPKPAPATK